MTRRFWVLVHRYAGLYMATFLVVAGLTGSLLAFNNEINEWLNPQFYKVPVQAEPMLDAFTLRERASALVPQGRINYVDLDRKPGAVYTAYAEPRTDPATKEPVKLEFSSLVLNPYTGAEIDRIKDGYWPLNRKNVMGFIYALHYSMALGDVGLWLFGIAATIWTLDCFVGFYLTLPRRLAEDAPRRSWWKRWMPAWLLAFRGEPYRINFNLHRAAGLWVWPMLFVFAWSAVAFNLGTQVYNPVMKGVFGLEDAVDDLPKLPEPRPDPGLDWREAKKIGQRLMEEQAAQHGFSINHEQGLTYDAQKGVFYYLVQSSRDLHHHFGSTLVAFDGKSGAFSALSLPTSGNAAHTFTTWICALHMAGVWGTPMQVFVCLMGLVVAMLSITGVYLWWKRRRTARTLAAGDIEAATPK